MEITFAADPTVFDGRFANNGWLQELPKPITKLTWDNAVLLSPKLAEQFGITQRVGINGGEHGQSITDLVELELNGRTLRAAACIVPGHAENSVTLHFGYGRTAAGHVGNASWVQCICTANVCRPLVFNGRESSQTIRTVHAGLHTGASFDGRSRSRPSVYLRSISSRTRRSFSRVSTNIIKSINVSWFPNRS